MTENNFKPCLKLFLEEVEARRSTGELFEEACFSKFVQIANSLGNVGNLEYQPVRSEAEDYFADGWEIDGTYLYLATSVFIEDEYVQYISENDSMIHFRPF